MPPSKVTLRHIADKAGVSIMTVSRALRESKRVNPQTREYIVRAAAELGYRPDPTMARLMATVRKGRRRIVSSTLALVRVRMAQPLPIRLLYHYVESIDVQRHAEKHGYGLDEFILGPGGLSAARLQSVLAARAIEGVLFSVESSLGEITGIDFSKFASATFGYVLKRPELHRASTNMMQALFAACVRLEKAGCRRIGLAVTTWTDERAEHIYTGALLRHQAGIARVRRIPPMIFQGKTLKSFRTAYLQWFRKHRPDAVITFDSHVPEWTEQDLGLRISRDVQLVVNDWTDGTARFPGIFHNRPQVAAAAVDLVATQLFHGEYGVPAIPRQVLIPASWKNGTSLMD